MDGVINMHVGAQLQEGKDKKRYRNIDYTLATLLDAATNKADWCERDLLCDGLIKLSIRLLVQSELCKSLQANEIRA